MLNKDMAFTLA